MDQPTQPTVPPPTPPAPQNQATPPANKKPGLISPNNIYQSHTSQNLIKPVMTVRESYHSVPWKMLVFEVLAVIFAGSFGYSFARYLAGGSFWMVLTALLLWSSVEVVGGFIQKSIGRQFVVALLESVVLVLFFYPIAWQALMVTGIIVFLCLLWGYFSVRRELHNTLEVRFFTASGKVVGKVITAAVIFMIIMYGSLANDNGSLFISENGFNAFFNWTAGFVHDFYPSVPLTGSFGDFAEAVARMQLQDNAAFQNLPAAEQNAAMAESAEQFMDGFTKSTIAASSPTSNVLYGYLANLFANLQDRYNDLFIGGWGLLLFLILRSIGIIVVWVGQFVALIVYEILLAAGFMKISEQVATKEIIET
jgi:hypothetical protein